jgi:hypothetical protein
MAMWQAPCLPAPEAEVGVMMGALLQITTTSQSGPGQKNIVYIILKAIHSPAHLVSIGDIDRAPIIRTSIYVIRKIMPAEENYKKLFLIF